MSLASTVASAAMGFTIPSARIIRELDLRAGGAPIRRLVRRHEAAARRRGARQRRRERRRGQRRQRSAQHRAHRHDRVDRLARAGQQLDAGGADILAAMVVGYEIAGRIDEALTPGRMQRGFHGSVSTVFGGTVAAGRLLKLTPRRWRTPSRWPPRRSAAWRFPPTRVAAASITPALRRPPRCKRHWPRRRASPASCPCSSTRAVS